ncbi:MAG: FlaA1/EpsC-like NDP-sugar epimerase [Pseudoalteromonas tetraodonis]
MVSRFLYAWQEYGRARLTMEVFFTSYLRYYCASTTLRFSALMLLFSTLTNLDRRSKKLLQALYDSGASCVAFWLAYALDLTAYNLPLPIILVIAVSAMLIAPLCYVVAGIYRAVVRYMAGALGVRIILSSAVASTLLTLIVVLTVHHAAWRFGVDYALMLLALVSLPRVLLRWIIEKISLDNKPISVIYGAGAAGRQLLNAVRASGDMQVFAFMDDDTSLVGSAIMGIPVHSSKEPDSVVLRYKASVVLLAVPSSGLERRKKIISRLEALSLKVLSVPGLSDILSGKAGVSELQEVDIEDLLGREPVKPNPQLISKDVAGKTVMVTGAGGSIGSELCRQVLKQNPSKLVLVDISEYALYAIEDDLKTLAEKHGLGTVVVPVLCSVQDKRRMTAIMEGHAVNTVYHAAAYKHVPLVEQNPTRAITNNVQGTWYTALAALEAGVESFTLVSTDKAVRPTNVMGASKRLAELGIQTLAKEAEQQGKTTRFSMVRFGNVLGSSGSVVPRFRQQIKAGGPITVTHQDIIRYFMTIPEAAQLVIQAGAMAVGGDVFVLDMGEPVKIANLAERMVHLSGLRVKTAEQDGDIEIVYTGLRPGEKLFEELLVSGVELPTSHERICRTMEPGLSFDEWTELFDKLWTAVDNSDLVTLHKLLLDAPLHWAPESETLRDAGVAELPSSYSWRLYSTAKGTNKSARGFEKSCR